MKRHLWREIAREISHWDGVVMRLEHSKNHPRAIVSYAGAERFVVLSKTPSDHRSLLNQIGTVRRACREMGAERTS